MATTITTTYPEDVPMLTSSIGTLSATTDRQKVVVTLTRDPDGNADVFFQTTLYAYNERVELSGLGRLIEECFRKNNRIYDTIKVNFDDAGIEFIAMYCEYVLDGDFDPTRCFLCSSGSSIVHSNSVVLLSHWPTGSNSYLVKVVGIGPDGKSAMVKKEFTKSSTAMWVSFPVSQILDFALNSSEYETGDAITKVSYFAITCGNMQKLFYLAEDPEYLTFRYRNMFNAPEYVDVVGKVARKTKTERDLAVCDGHALHYNRSISRTYEVQTAALTEDQVKELEQLIGSHYVELCTGSDILNILITDHTCEPDNDDESLMTMKFSFRMSSTRPTVRDTEMGALLQKPSEIFTEEFTAEFS